MKNKPVKKPTKPKGTPGPKPELLKAERDWQELVDRVLANKRPAQGWAIVIHD
jgi:hypothetical protein